MVNPQLLEYMQKAKQAGQTDDQTRTVLYKNGWSEQEISENFQAAGFSAQSSGAVPLTKPAPETAKPSIKTEPMATYSFPDRKRGRLAGLLVSIIIILVLFSAIGAGLALYSHFWDPLWNPFRPSPESVILKAWNNLNSIKSENFNSEFSLINSNGSFKVNAKANGGVDNSDVNNKLALIQGSLTANVKDSAGSQHNLSLAGEIRLLSKTLYFKLDDVNLGGLEGLLLMFGLDLNDFKGQWIKIDTEKTLEQYSNTIPVQQAELEKNYQEALNKIVKILLDKKVYDINQFPDNQGSEEKEYHYSVSLNRKKLIDASPEIFNVLKDYFSKSTAGQLFQPDFTLENFQKSINDMLDKIGDMSADLFIGEKDNFFHKIQVSEKLDISKFNAADSGVVEFNYKIEQSGINKPVQVLAPTDYKNLEDIIGPLVKAQQTRTDMSQIGFIAQSVFSANKSYYSLCKNGLLNGYLNTYGQELINLNNDIIKQGAKKPVCFSSIKNYCVSTQLQDGSWLCIGQNGILGKVKCVSAQTNCQ